MTKRSIFGLLLAVSALFVPQAFSQSDRGTMTGTVSDSTGAVIANAPVQAKNSGTGVVYDSATSTTGNYTISQLPAGNYEISVSAPGFKKYTRAGLTIEVAQVLRVDIALEVGASTESVTVTAAATLLNTETGDVRHDIRADSLDDLPVLGIGASQAGSSGIRNPNAMVNLIPGTYFIANAEVRVNGAPDNTQSFRIEGQDASNTGTPGVAAQTQPSVDAIQEIAIQTSNYAAEYGQAGGGVFNLTMKSGGNQFHGSAYDYFINEDLNAGNNFAVPARPRNRRNDYGFTVGGPVWIPKVYNGHDKTFFFFNFEQFREALGIIQSETVPTAAYRTGDFGTAIPTNAASLGTLYPGGPSFFQGEVFDPTTSNTPPGGGTAYRTPFPNNTVPVSRFDPLAAKIQSLFPAPQNGGVVNNFIPNIPTTRVTQIPSVKIDQTIGNNGRLSFFWQRTQTTAPVSATFGQIDGLPDPLATNLGTFQNAPLYRLNYDHTLSPTLLLHLGLGYRSNYFFVPTVTEQGVVPNFNTTAFGFNGSLTNIFFPPISGLCSGASVSSCSGQGGMMNFGSAAYATNISQVPSFNASATKVSGNHTYKAGAEIRFEGYPGHSKANSSGTYAFSPNQTGPFAGGSALGGANPPGFGYASFLLGLVNTVGINSPIDPKLGKTVFGSYVQDSWKVTHNLTVDYGLRWDYSTYLKEEHGRNAYFSPTTPNPALGGILGAVAFDGDGPGHCNCDLAKNYPWAFGPRLGVAYQFTPKTVFRSGFGIIYAPTESNNNANTTIPSSASGSLGTSSVGLPVTTLSQGVAAVPAAYPKTWPNYNPSQFNPTGNPASTQPVFLDPNAGRPARQYQWSAGIQRELMKDLVIDVSYIGNRGIWWYAPSLTNVNAINPATIAADGLDLNSAADRALLAGPLSAAASRGFKAPYASFPLTQTLAQSLRPFPQFGTIIDYWAPLGDTWYNALQVKVTKRLSHGVTFVSTFAKQKTLDIGTERDANPGTNGNAVTNNVFNRDNNKYISQYDQPLVWNLSLTYVTPKWGSNKIMSWVTRDWTLGTFLQYASGLPIQSPSANAQPGDQTLNSLLFTNIPGAGGSAGTFASRVPGQPLFNVDLNCGCYDPSKTFSLNPAAWANPPGGQFGTSAAYYNDYRTQRRPTENLNFGRTFRIKERYALNIRAEFSNIFNRAFWNNPTATNAQATQTRVANSPTGVAVSGFGYMNTTTFSQSSGANILPRQGVLVARFTF
ncbi:MAG TPA: TonB-dependent receptor [Bryobacteraceae bacterium]|nr:TonB-dependent receptor [Bryobacteraceae bacterium]